MSWLRLGGGGSLPFDADDEDEFGLGGHVVGSFLLAKAGEANLLALGVAVFFYVGFGALEDDAAFFFLGLGKGMLSMDWDFRGEC